MTLPRHLTSLLLVALAAAASACGSDEATPTTATTTSPTTVAWTGIIGPRGTASRSFETSQTGIVTVTLTASDVAMGIGIGIPRAANGGCRLTISEVDSAGVSLSLPADTGSYCVQVFDDGSVAGPSNFAIQIVYP